jgi:pre-mRNA-processing factor 17
MLFCDLAPDVDLRVLRQHESSSRRRLGSVPISPDAVAVSDFGPSAALLSTHEDVIAAYGAEVTASSLRVGDNADEEENQRKRRRSSAESSNAVQQRGAPSSSFTVASPASSVVTSAAFSPYGAVQASVDYQGRSFLHVPSHLATDFRGKNRLPSRPVFMIKNISTSPSPSGAETDGAVAGVQCLKWMPPVGHLLFSADLNGCVRLWDVTQQQHRQVAEYAGHAMPVRSLEVSRGTTAPRLSTASVDGTIRQWDVETATLTETLRHASGKPCLTHRYHPFNQTTSEEEHGGPGGDARLIVAAVHDKIVLWDVRVSCDKPQREYSGHTGAILHIAFLDGGRKLLTTSEDKTMRTWEYRVPVQIRQFADAAMHAISHVQAHPKEEYLAAQSFDDTIVVIRDEGGGKVKFLREKVFSGHTIAGSACQLQFSPDGEFLSSGDVNGAIHIWKWATGERLRTFAAHAPGKPLVSHLWHPTEPSRMVTSSWDGTIRMWG